MDKKAISEEHSYAASYRNSRGILVAFALFLTMIGIFIFVTTLNTAVPSGLDDSKILSSIWNFMLYSIWSPLILIFTAYLYPDITRDAEGLHFKFLFRTYNIRWDEILYSKTAKPFRLSMQRHAVLVVTKSRLTFFHRLYGLLYGNTSDPSFLILSTISNFSHLTKAISAKAKENQRINKR